VDKPGLDKFRGKGWSRLEVDWLFFAQETALLTQGIVQKRSYRWLPPTRAAYFSALPGKW
jgi:hypothetical protein